MTGNWIVHGDVTTSGGRMISSSPFTDVDGKGVCRKGDKATCPQHKGVFPITGGYDPTTIIDDQEVALHGATLACGCKVLSTQQMRVYLDAGGGSMASSDRPAAASTTSVAMCSATAAAAANPASDREASEDTKKSVSRVYWSYGEDEIPLASKSRFFVDLNIHIETVNYLPGETIEVVVQGAGEQSGGAEFSPLSLQAVVQSDGTAKILDVFRGKRVDLYATA